MTIPSDYGQTNQALQQNINEALLQLGNIRSQINGLGIGDITLPTPPEVNAPNPTFPSQPAPPAVQSVQFPQVTAGGVTANIPTAPALQTPTGWAGPDRPQRYLGFEQFFTGDVDTPEEVIERANEAVTKWVDDYFPAMNNCFKDVPEQWICDVISGVRPLGNSEEAIAIAWRAAKANQYKDTQSAKRTLSAEFASRGFSIPPGAMLAAMERLHEQGMDLNAAANREAALKDIDVQARLLEVAVTTAAQLKQGLMGIMADYYRVIASLSNDAAQYGIEKARIKAQADAQFNEAVLRFSDINQGYYRSLRDNLLQQNGQYIDLYSARLQGSDVAVRAQETSERLKLEAARTNSENKRTEVGANVDIERMKADVYRAAVGAEGTRVSATNDVNRIRLEAYRTEVEGRLAEAQAKAPPAVGTALSGAASAFGQIAAYAASASGTLIARVSEQ